MPRPLPRARPISRPHRRRRGGFTLIEILICLAIIAAVSTVMIASATLIFEKDIGIPPPPKLLKLAVREARFQAASHKEPTLLRFDAETAAFIVTNEGGSPLAEPVETGYDPESGDLEVNFFQTLPSRGLDSVRPGQEQLSPISHVVFHPDRSSTPFTAVLKFDGEETKRRYDPFSDTELVNPGEAGR